MDTPTPPNNIELVYDRECPACDFYCRHAEIADATRALKRIDARESSAILDEITRAGLDIDQGMVVKKDGTLYYGSEAIHQLALLAPRRGIFNRLSRALFASRTSAHVLYPVLRGGRNLLLKLLRKTKINNLRRSGNDRF